MDTGDTYSAASDPPAEGAKGPAGTPLTVFVNYRHEDTQGMAWALFMRLGERFGAENVFFDKGSLQPGRRWFDEICSHGARSGVVIVLIGPRWMSMLTTHQVYDEVDYVAEEIRLALRSNSAVTLIPVLVDDAELPDPAALPSSLQPLTRYQAERIRHANFLDDTEHLITRLAGIAKSSRATSAGPALPGLSAPAAPRLEPAAPVGHEASVDDAEDGAEAEERQSAVAAQPSASSQVAVYDELVRSAFADLVKPGRLLFNPPDRMQLDQRVRVEVRLTRTLKLDAELLENLRGPGEPRMEEIPTAPLMAVTLKGEAFQMTAYSDEEQSVTPDGITTWEFDVRALKRGSQHLVMCVSLRIPVLGQAQEHKSMPVREAVINVEVGAPALVAHFVSDNWQWFIGTVIAIAAVLVAVLFH